EPAPTAGVSLRAALPAGAGPLPGAGAALEGGRRRRPRPLLALSTCLLGLAPWMLQLTAILAAGCYKEGCFHGLPVSGFTPGRAVVRTARSSAVGATAVSIHR